MKNRLLILGAGGHGKVTADIATKMNRWQSIGFLEDNDLIQSYMDIRVVGKVQEANQYIQKADFFVGIGNNQTREKLQEKLEACGASFATLIHPSAMIGPEVEIGAGSAIMAGVVINCSCKIGKGCIVNTGSCLDHDNRIEDYVHVSPGVSTAGNVNIGRSTWLGIGSIIVNNISICGDCIIGAGAVVTRNIMETGTYVGVPARKLDGNSMNH